MMFGTLFWQELKITTKSITYFIFVLCLLGFVYSQGGTSFHALTKPQPDQKEYGSTPTSDKQLIQRVGYSSLLSEWENNKYSTYPYGFIKNVSLSETEQQEIKDIIEKASQQTMAQLMENRQVEVSQLEEGAYYEGYRIPIDQGHDYQQFKKDMKTVTTFIGKGSAYELDMLESQTNEPMTYEEAMQEFNHTVEDEKVSGTYARDLCDYFAIILGLLPVFLGATVCLRDRRSGVQGVIFAKGVSSFKLITVRFLSTVVAILIPVFLFCIMPGWQTLYIANQVGAEGSLPVFFSTIAVWLIPVVVAVTGLSFLTTELFGGMIAIIIQLVWWFLTIFMGRKQLAGHVGLSLIPRFDQVTLTDVFQEIRNVFLLNRLFYLGFGLLCFGLMVLIYQWKRGGGRLVKGK